MNSRDAVDEIYEDLTAAGYTGEQRPYDAFWGARYAIVNDPDGNSVGIMSPIDPGLKALRLPPDSPGPSYGSATRLTMQEPAGSRDARPLPRVKFGRSSPLLPRGRTFRATMCQAK